MKNLSEMNEKELRQWMLTHIIEWAISPEELQEGRLKKLGPGYLIMHYLFQAGRCLFIFGTASFAIHSLLADQNLAAALMWAFFCLLSYSWFWKLIVEDQRWLHKRQTMVDEWNVL